jgi:predicted DNA-binding transcriptional regulator AlpA
MTTNAFKPLTKDDVADVLGVSLRTIENWVSDEILPAPKKLGNRVYWHPNIFYTWLEHRLTSEDANDALESVVGTKSGGNVGKAKQRTQHKHPKTEIDKLRSREQAKLDTMLSFEPSNV